MKCATQHILSVVPGGASLNYLMQRHVSKSLPVSDTKIDGYRKVAACHLEHYRAVFGRRPDHVLEIGSGQHLAVAIMVAQAGPQVIATDVRPNARPELVDDMLQRLGAGSMSSVGVTYRAPFEPTEQDAGTLDMVISNSVLEHVHAADLHSLLYDCRKVLRPGGICSFSIDYHDHWSAFDKSISPHNFLRYGELRWKLLNPELQYQNRLRHPDYVDIFTRSGFRILRAYVHRQEEPRVTVHRRFGTYTKEDLSVLGAWFVLRKK